MRVIEHFDELEHTRFPVITIGTFDGVHYGHQKILSGVANNAKSNNGESIVITFWPHPRFVLGKDAAGLKLLSTFEEKAELIAQCNIDYLLKVRFSRKFSELSSKEFTEKVLVNGLKAKKLIIGYDHKFGHDQEGSFENLKASESLYGFKVEEIPRQDIDDVGVSSTKIRNALLNGDIGEANESLGRKYELSGIIIKGDQVGRKIGFPTANIYIPEEYKLVPADGVYAVIVYVNGDKLKGMLNIGNRPTLNSNTKTIEVNIFDFNRDIYGQKIRICFVKQLRKEIKFEGLDQLKIQLEKDKIAANKILFV